MSSDYTCPEEVWDLLEPLIPQHLPKPHPLGCYRQPIPDRQVADAIWYVMRTGCQWGALDPTGLAKHSTAHARFQEWVRAGVFFRLWQKSLEGFDCLVGLDGHWLCVDGARGKAPLGGKETGKNPTDRGKLGVKRSVAIEGHGVPVGLVIAGASPSARLPTRIHLVAVGVPFQSSALLAVIKRIFWGGISSAFWVTQAFQIHGSSEPLAG